MPPVVVVLLSRPNSFSILLLRTLLNSISFVLIHGTLSVSLHRGAHPGSNIHYGLEVTGVALLYLPTFMTMLENPEVRPKSVVEAPG